jgi:hypothetical protein
MARNEEFQKMSLKVWSGALDAIFPGGIPQSKQWTDLRTIASVLNMIGQADQSNHMFYPTGGGMDLIGASKYEEEPGCLALQDGDRSFDVVKPEVLLFESFGPELEWAYFRLECLPMPPTGVYEPGAEGKREEVVLVEPGTYAPRSAWDNNSFEGEDLTDDAKLIVRSISGGPITIFAKGSTFNFAGGRADAYSGYHAKMSAEEFKAFIQSVIDSQDEKRAGKS